MTERWTERNSILYDIWNQEKGNADGVLLFILTKGITCPRER